MNIYLQIHLLLAVAFILFKAFRLVQRKLGSGSFQPLLKGAQIALLASLAAPAALSFVPSHQLPQIDFVARSPLAETRRIDSRNHMRWHRTPPLHAFPQKKAVAAPTWRYYVTWESSLKLLEILLLMGALARVTWLGRNALALRRLIGHSTEIRRIGHARVLVSDFVEVPFSLLAPFKTVAFVVVPSALLTSRRDFSIALKHELQHHRNGDTFWALFAELLTIPLFWNPAIWLWKKEINELQELSCDEALLGRNKVSMREYGSCLLRVAEAALGNRLTFAGTANMASASRNPKRIQSFLRRRIDMFTQTKNPKARTRLGFWIGTAAALCTVAFAFGSQQSFRGPDSEHITPGQAPVDPEIQQIAENVVRQEVQKKGAKAAFAIVADPNTGRVLAVANVDVENPQAGKSWALATLIEPASIAKSFVAASALDQGLTQPEEVLDCGKGNFRFGHNLYHDWKSFDKLTTTQAIAQSSNICGIKLGLKLGTDGLEKTLKNFGFGSGGTASEFPGARPGDIANSSQLSREDYIALMSTGYSGKEGYVVDPLEIVAAYSAFANGGRLLKPIPVNAPDSAITVLRQVISEKTSSTMRDILREVVLTGTGVQARSKLYTTAGKTGSAYAQTDPDHDLLGGQSAVASFVGFAPASNPKVVIYAVMMDPSDDHGQAHGNSHAAPIFRQIAEQTLQHMGVAPDVR